MSDTYDPNLCDQHGPECRLDKPDCYILSEWEVMAGERLPNGGHGDGPNPDLDRIAMIRAWPNIELAIDEYLKRPDFDRYSFEGISEITDYGIELRLQEPGCSCCPSDYGHYTMPWDWVADIEGRADTIRRENEAAAEKARQKAKERAEAAKQDQEARERAELARLQTKYNGSAQ